MTERPRPDGGARAGVPDRGLRHRFPALSEHRPPSAVEPDDLYAVAPASGATDVVLHTDRHDLTLADLGPERVRRLDEVRADRCSPAAGGSAWTSTPPRSCPSPRASRTRCTPSADGTGPACRTSARIETLPYVMAVQQAPTDGGDCAAAGHLRVEFTPVHRTADRLKFLAGAELAAGAFLNDTEPEASAAALRAARERAHR